MARGSVHLLRVQLQQSTTGSGLQLGLHHNACLVRLHLSCDFSASLLFCPLFAAVVSRAVTIHQTHDSVRITIFDPRFGSYHDFFVGGGRKKRKDF